MSEIVMRKHIDLYVNKYSIHLGEQGIAAVKKLLAVYLQLHPEQTISSEHFYLSNQF
jgi:1,4-dihydroxy-6-naphthoate synthase